jgi:signal transduction histidine kinase
MKLDIVSIDTDEFLGEVYRSAHILTKDKPVEIRLEKETDTNFILADKVRLRQIMWNLISNAVKFTEQGSVTIKYGQQADMIYVQVIDTGIGIPEDKIGLIFERFSQVDGSSTRRAGGTGLGLTITQQLVQLHGGEIHVESKFGVGSTFTFTMPVYAPESAAS